MIYGYCRVSTVKQLDGNSLEQQRELILKDYPTAVIVEEQYTGGKMDRPKFSKLISNLKEGDMLVVTKLDRFARSTTQGLETVEFLLSKGVRVNILNIGLMDNTPASELIRTIFLAFAQFEKSMILERTRDGKVLARERGDLREGRPRKYNPKTIEKVLDEIESGQISYRSAADLYRISTSTLTRRMRERKSQQMTR